MSQLMSDSRVRWACRRGMLELDVKLLPFFENCYAELSEAQKLTFQQLLAQDDPDLFAWFMGHQQCENPEMAAIIEQIRSYYPY